MTMVQTIQKSFSIIRTYLENHKKTMRLIDHAYAMCQYTRRYGKVHKSIYAIEWCGKNYHRLNLPKIGLTPLLKQCQKSTKMIALLKHTELL